MLFFVGNCCIFTNIIFIGYILILGSGKLDKPLNILLVEDDQEECKAFVRVTDPIDDVRLIGVTNNENKALEYVKDYLPDAIILDLELHKGSGSGISFLTTLNKMRMKFTPYILVTTHNISRITHKQARHLGADYIMVKSQEDYSVKNVVDFLRSLKNVIHDSRQQLKDKGDLTDESPGDIRKRLETRVTTEIDLIGISPKALGRNYLIDAIMLKTEGQTHQIAEIARKYCKTDASVERAMQNAINKAWSTMQPDDLMLHYTARIQSEKGVPTLMEFIYHYANKLKNEY